MASITGEWREGTGRKVWKNLRLSIQKYTQTTANDIVDRAQYDLSRWEDDVAEVLSDPLAKSEWHKLRDPNRRFPHMNRGNQLRSIESHAKMTPTAAGNYSITAWAEIGKPYAHFTSLGYKQREDGDTPQWIGWLDDVFNGSRGFFSVADVFDRLVLERQGTRQW